MEELDFIEELLNLFAVDRLAEVYVKDEEYLNLKTAPDYSELLRKSYNYIIPAYHMNKEHWNTVIINKDIDEKLIYELIDQSYELTKNKSKKNPDPIKYPCYKVVNNKG